MLKLFRNGAVGFIDWSDGFVWQRLCLIYGKQLLQTCVFGIVDVFAHSVTSSSGNLRPLQMSHAKASDIGI